MEQTKRWPFCRWTFKRGEFNANQGYGTRTVFSWHTSIKGKGVLICVCSVYYEKPICQKDIYHFLVLMKGRNNKKVLVVAVMLKKRVVGNFHQVFNIFPEWSWGRQCVSNTLINILYKYLNLKNFCIGL